MADVLDTTGMWDATASLPEQVFDASVAARGLEGLPDRERIENVVVLGMGGSGIAGDLLVASAGPFLPVPIVVVKGYEAPAFVGESSLVFAISFSGNTEETVEAAQSAAVEGGNMVIITSGGELGRLAESWSVPWIRVPDDIPFPRAALGAQAIPPLVVLEEMGLFPGAQVWIDEAVEQLRKRRDQLTGEKSPAREVAKSIGRTIPLIYGGGAVGEAAAKRWKADVNENANAPAFWNVHPELCHAEYQGWGQHGDVTRQVFTLIKLRHEFEHPQIARRFELTEAAHLEVLHGTEEIWAEGEGQLAQALDLMLFGDFTTLEMAAIEGIDPGPIDALEQLKLSLRA
jgi:glucose/mannose-6-phosphate isomerase